jgi:hypothetical protein
MMQRPLTSLLLTIAAVVTCAAPVGADSGVVTDARVGLQDSHGWISPADAIKKYGTVRGLRIVFTYQFAADPPLQGAQPYDVHQVRYSVNGAPENQVSPVDAHEFDFGVAQPATHYVLKVQGCRKGLFGSDCTAWFERRLDTPPDTTPRPQPTVPPPAPLPQTPQPTPRHIVLPHFPAPAPVPFAINAPQATVGASTRLQCLRLAGAGARAECVANVADGKMLVRWSWQRTPCNAVTCYAADAYVIESGGVRITVDAGTRLAWVARPSDPEGCVSVGAMHTTPVAIASTSACLPPARSHGKPQ